MVVVPYKTMTALSFKATGFEGNGTAWERPGSLTVSRDAFSCSIIMHVPSHAYASCTSATSRLLGNLGPWITDASSNHDSTSLFSIPAFQ